MDLSEYVCIVEWMRPKIHSKNRLLFQLHTITIKHKFNFRNICIHIHNELALESDFSEKKAIPFFQRNKEIYSMKSEIVPLHHYIFIFVIKIKFYFMYTFQFIFFCFYSSFIIIIPLFLLLVKERNKREWKKEENIHRKFIWFV